MKIRCIYSKLNNLRFISHLDTVNLMQRAIFSTNVKIQFSEGFNPHPKMSFGNPLPLGVSSNHELFDITLAEKVDLEEFKYKLNQYLPKDIQILKAFLAGEENISKMYNFATYQFIFTTDEDISSCSLKSEDELIIKRKIKVKNKFKNANKDPEFKEENIINHVKYISDLAKIDDNTFTFTATLENSSDKIINPNAFVEGLMARSRINVSLEDFFVHKKEMLKL